MRETISCVSQREERERERESEWEEREWEEREWERKREERASVVPFIASKTDINHAEIPQSTESPVCGPTDSGDHS